MANNGMGRKIASGISWSYSERILAQFVGTVVSIILARILDPAHYGIIAIVTVFISILDALVIGGFGNALIQKKGTTDEDFDTICWFSVCISVLLYFVLYSSAPFIATFYNMPQLTTVTRVMAIRTIISAYNSVQHAYVQKHMEFKKFFFSTLGGTLISAVVGIYMAYHGFGVWALVAQYMTNSFIDSVVLTLTISWKPKLRFSMNSLKSMFGFGIKMIGATLVNTLQDNIRSLVVGKQFSEDTLAFYNTGKKYPQLLMSDIVGSLGKVLFPAFSAETSKKDIKELMRKSVRLSSFILLPLMCGFLAVADNFVSIFLTDKWLGCVVYMRIIGAIYLARPLNTIFQQSLLAVGRSDANLVHEVVGSVLSIVLIFVAVFAFNSVLLIAISSIFVMLVGTVIFALYVKNEYDYKFSEMMLDYLPYLLISVMMTALVLFIGTFEINKYCLIVIQVLVGMVSYFLLAKLFHMNEVKTVQGLIRNRMKKSTP